MKKIRNLIVIIILTVGYNSFAQAPQSFNYQAVYEDVVGGDEITTIIKRNNSEVFTEIHTLVAGENYQSETGLISLMIGSDEDLTDVDWAAGGTFILRIKINGVGTGEDITIISVPYALHANTATMANDVPVELIDNDLTIGETTVNLPSGGLYVPNPDEPVVEVVSLTSPNRTILINPDIIEFVSYIVAEYYCDNLETYDRIDWRLPNRREMTDIYHQNHLLADVVWGYYWTTDSLHNEYYTLKNPSGTHVRWPNNDIYIHAVCISDGDAK